MLGGQDHPFESGVADDPAPLFAVHPGGMEGILRFGSVAPFPAGEGVDGKVDECVHAHILPGKLLSGRRSSVRSRCGIGCHGRLLPCFCSRSGSEWIFRVRYMFFPKSQVFPNVFFRESCEFSECGPPLISPVFEGPDTGEKGR